MRKLLAIVISVFFSLVSAQAEHDFIFLGDERAAMPGPNLPGSFYDDNPATVAETAFNALSVGFGFFPSSISRGGAERNGYGSNFVLSIPNFRLFQISGQSQVHDIGSDVPSSVFQDMLALQFGLSTLDLGIELPVAVAAGVQLNRLTRGLAEDAVNVSESGVQEAALDLGIVLSSGIMKLSVRAMNLILLKLGGEEDSASSLNFEGGLSGRLLLDIGYELKLATAMAYDFVDFSIAGQLSRSFFSNSLQTGVLLRTYVDASSTERRLPIYQYGMSVSYAVPGLGSASGALGLLNLFSGLVLNGRASIQISNLDGLEATIPVVALGIAKSF